MKTIIPITDLQRQAAKILSEVKDSSEPIIITQRGRPAAVLLSAKRYAEIEDDLAEFDDLELEYLIALGEKAKKEGDVLSLEEVRNRLRFPD